MKDYNIYEFVNGLKEQNKKEFINSEISKIKKILEVKKVIVEDVDLSFKSINEQTDKRKELVEIKNIELKKIKNILKI